MRVGIQEQAAIREVVKFGSQFGYGNLISHLQTAWRQMLIDKYNMPYDQARQASGGDGMPYRMHRDILEHGNWDEKVVGKH